MPSTIFRIVAHGCEVALNEGDASRPSSSARPRLTASEKGIRTLSIPPNSGNHFRPVVSATRAVSRVKQDIWISSKWSRTLRSRGWGALRVSRRRGDCEKDDGWRVRAYDVLVGDERCIVILGMPNTAEWMSGVPDDTPLGDLTIPGTHESCALYGYPISQCQQPSTPISQQLHDGVRFLDVRLRVVGDELLMYHGPRPQRSSLPVLLDSLHSFLAAHPSEMVLLCLKEESPPFHPSFARLVCRSFKTFRATWFLENRIPQLGEVRGRGVLVTRFEDPDGEWKGGMGVHPSTWPDSRKAGFEWDCNGTTVRTQDWYRVPTFLEIPEKFAVTINSLVPTLEADPTHPFTLSYTSASSFPLALPTVIAKGFGWPNWGLGVYGINARLSYWLLVQITQGRRIRACLPMDFYRQCGDERGLAEILVSMNFL